MTHSLYIVWNLRWPLYLFMWNYLIITTSECIFSISTNYNLVSYNVRVSFTHGKTHMFVKLIGIWDNNCFLRKRIPLQGGMTIEQNRSNCWCLTTKEKHFKNLDMSNHFCMRIIIMFSEKNIFFYGKKSFNFKYVYKDLDIRFLVWKVINKYKIFL